jgi:hypothetical protein
MNLQSAINQMALRRMKNMIKWFLFFSIISLTAFSQQTIEGRVVDKETGSPIPFASIGVIGTSKGTTSNLQGQFSLVVSGSISIKVTCVGYESQVINSIEEMQLVQLKSIATQLNEVYIFNKAINPKKIVRKAFASIPDNYADQGFLQRFFYRHYSKKDSVYERVIEASVDVWKHQGYQKLRRFSGDNEELRITQLRRSLDIAGMVQGQTPISVGSVLQADVVGYQSSTQNNQLKIFEEVSNLKGDFENYTFTFDGITNYDGQEVYKIGYSHKKDSILTTSGHIDLPEASGSLFITTDRYAFVKTEDVKSDKVNTIRSTAYYRKYDNKYYPYHFIRQGENNFFNNTTHAFHIELMSVEIRNEATEKFSGHSMEREDLLNVSYDSSFWNTTTILKTTPLEDEIIYDLGGGRSLNKQFLLYKEYELNVTDGGKNGEQKFSWLVENSKGKRILYVCFWNSDFQSYLIDMEYIKRLNQIYKNKIMFVLISLEDDEAKWQQLVTKYNYFSDGIINYRIGGLSETAKRYSVKKAPSYILISKDGNLLDLNPKRPSDPQLEKDFKSLLELSGQ